MTENEKKLSYLRDSLEGCSAASIRKFIATSLGSVPGFGGMISAISGLKDDHDSKKINEVLLSVLKDHDDKISCIWNAVFGNEPSREKLNYLFCEIFGIEIPTTYIEGYYFVCLMSPFSREEFRVYENLGWLKIKSTGSVISNFSNSIAGHKKEIKRTDGPGYGYCISLTNLYYNK